MRKANLKTECVDAKQVENKREKEVVKNKKKIHTKKTVQKDEKQTGSVDEDFKDPDWHREGLEWSDDEDIFKDVNLNVGSRAKNSNSSEDSLESQHINDGPQTNQFHINKNERVETNEGVKEIEEEEPASEQQQTSEECNEKVDLD